MARSQFRSIRKVSGTKYVSLRKKRLGDLGRNPALTLIGKVRLKLKRTLGGNSKRQLLSNDFVSVATGKKTVKLKIESVENNPANINYTRRNVITKGCIVKTEKGDVRITSRPGQTGTLMGVFV
jgi:small subunit ribosomal protein S8e